MCFASQNNIILLLYWGKVEEPSARMARKCIIEWSNTFPCTYWNASHDMKLDAGVTESIGDRRRDLVPLLCCHTWHGIFGAGAFSGLSAPGKLRIWSIPRIAHTPKSERPRLTNRDGSTCKTLQSSANRSLWWNGV